ncbi:ABC transporter substrate-binding protein [Rhodovulum adriaticum]|uniref:Maltose-binding protein /trehalose-binding protein /sucrose-binding protein n=1 Tax=Rhodovulum adriaticum TaxID=35804 RepID=A0A4R2NMB4_RHOAD|nr:ABC transporter substrate-binding protein [Rhodovulum adriaticum]MBK1636925.1 alpha-glucoside ABC transporter substrate-binding protein [Rhodovulum adriaticum]TCP22799.1 maltose-binding protein /trehalose-binding protein /sucrose-binding protein [Rhodovulum adriaticum]
MNTKRMSCAAVLALAAGTAQAQELLFAPGEDARFNWESFDSFSETDLSGEVLTITGPWTGADKDLVESVLAYFEAATGATVNYSGSDSFEQDVVIAAQAGSPPDIAVFPQPGLAADMARRGYLAPLGADTAEWVRSNYAAGDSWVDLGTYADAEGQEALFGFFYKVDLKSLVWYVPDNFDEAGYDIPQTMEELKDLTVTIAAEGGTPWCIGLGSAAATGWPATDWVEDLMLRTQPPEVYDAWVANEMPFDDPRVIAAIEEFGWFARNDDFVAGGAANVATTDFRDSPAGLFSFPPECYMHRQASFIPTFFPEGAEMGLDVDFFYFPAYAGKDLGTPVLGAGTLWAIMQDSPAARAFVEFLKTPIAHEVWMAQSGFLTPYKAANPQAYATDSLRAQGEILTNATTFRFDGSDLMPGEIGADAFWKGMVAYTTGEGAKAVARDIQARWDALR